MEIDFVFCGIWLVIEISGKIDSESMSPGALRTEVDNQLISATDFQSNGNRNSSTIEARFADIKLGVSIDENTWNQAMHLLRETKYILVANMSENDNRKPEEIERQWFMYIIFSAKKLSQANAENGLNLCQIMKLLNISIVDFVNDMPEFVLKTGHILSKLYGSDWEKRLEAKELERSITLLSILSRQYRRAFVQFFLIDAKDDKHPTIFSDKSPASDCYRFGWLLFLALRTHTLGHCKDLFTCAIELVSILVILILHVPARFRKFTYEYPFFVKEGNKGVDLIASLCKSYQTSQDELRTTVAKVNDLIVNMLKKKPHLASECKAENLENFNTDGLVYFEDLMEAQSLESSLLILEKDYNNNIQNKVELDERVFLSCEDNLLANGSFSGGVISICGSKRRFDLMASPSKTISSPLSLPWSSSLSGVTGGSVGNDLEMTPTPVKTTMATVKWLRTVISSCPSKPSAKLECFLSSCDRDLTNDVIYRANVILGAIFPGNAIGERLVVGNLQCATLMDSIWAEERKIEALKLYYRVLEAICRAEIHVDGVNLTSLLSNERFHRCMLACSAELVLASYMTVTMLFPAVLEKTGITAFDLSKVIESFVIHEETLPKELRTHLNSLEERLLESMAWEKGSSMYNSLIVAKPTLSAEINRLGLLAEPMPSLDAIAMHQNISKGAVPSMPMLQKKIISPGTGLADKNGDVRSPRIRNGGYKNVTVECNSFTLPVKNPLHSAFVSPTKPHPSGRGETYAELGIRVFFTKVIKLAHVRIKSLCQRLQLSEQFWERVCYLIQQILNQRTTLFFNRHIDQLILCSFYGVAKVSQLSLTFREIMSNYRKQPQSRPEVFCVFVGCTSSSRNVRTRSEHVAIITFYNEIFIPAVKPLLMELDPVGSLDSGQHEDKSTTDVRTLGPPQFSSFPSLPDISPKKVSAAHNIYVSPLRPSKMDTLISSSSRSYYACIGESTRPYQSPSKDLSAINDCLNRRSKVSRRLSMGDVGFISDSMVLSSLYQQNGSSASSCGAASTLNGPLKNEQTDP